MEKPMDSLVDMINGGLSASLLRTKKDIEVCVVEL